MLIKELHKSSGPRDKAMIKEYEPKGIIKKLPPLTAVKINIEQH
jgi:hypothetical protein